MLKSYSPKVMTVEVGPLGGDWGHAGGALMNGISALIKDTPERSLALLLCEDTVRKRLSMKKYVLTRH